MIKFLSGTDVLILDSQYDAVEYERHAGWGHGCVDDSVALALAAKVKRLCLFHHDPERSDKQLDASAPARAPARDPATGEIESGRRPRRNDHPAGREIRFKL